MKKDINYFIEDHNIICENEKLLNEMLSLLKGKKVSECKILVRHLLEELIDEKSRLSL